MCFKDDNLCVGSVREVGTDILEVVSRLYIHFAYPSFIVCPASHQLYKRKDTRKRITALSLCNLSGFKADLDRIGCERNDYSSSLLLDSFDVGISRIRVEGPIE